LKQTLNDDGRVFKTRYISPPTNNAVETAQLDDVTFHTLPAHVRIVGDHARVTLKELQELLGHSSLAMTMRYADLASGAQGPPRSTSHFGAPGSTRRDVLVAAEHVGRVVLGLEAAQPGQVGAVRALAGIRRLVVGQVVDVAGARTRSWRGPP
jgi:hypothetical protein